MSAGLSVGRLAVLSVGWLTRLSVSIVRLVFLLWLASRLYLVRASFTWLVGWLSLRLGHCLFRLGGCLFRCEVGPFDPSCGCLIVSLVGWSFLWSVGRSRRLAGRSVGRLRRLPLFLLLLLLLVLLPLSHASNGGCHFPATPREGYDMPYTTKQCWM